jgi:hypothetical protein
MTRPDPHVVALDLVGEQFPEGRPHRGGGSKRPRHRVDVGAVWALLRAEPSRWPGPSGT